MKVAKNKVFWRHKNDVHELALNTQMKNSVRHMQLMSRGMSILSMQNHPLTILQLLALSQATQPFTELWGMLHQFARGHECKATRAITLALLQQIAYKYCCSLYS